MIKGVSGICGYTGDGRTEITCATSSTIYFGGLNKNGFLNTSATLTAFGQIDSVGFTVGSTSAAGQIISKILTASGVDKAPVISLFRTGAREGVIAIDGSSNLIIANASGLADYNDATLTAAANLTISNTGAATFAGAILAANGSAAAPSISFASDTDTGFYWNGSGEVGFASNAASSLLFGSSGRIWGGVSASAALLTLGTSGGVTLTANGTNQNITLTPSGSGNVTTTRNYLTSDGNIYGWGSATAYILGNSSTNLVSFYTSSAEKMRLNSSGRLLLGTTVDSSNGILQLAASTASSGGIGFGTDTFLYRIGNGGLAINGSTAPAIYLQFSGVNHFRLLYNNGSDVRLETLSATPLQFMINSTTALTLDTALKATFAGAVAISSTTSGSSSAGALVVAGGISAKNLFITAAVPTYDHTNPSIAFSAAGGALGFYSQSNTVYFASTATRVLGFSNTGLVLSINGDVTSPNIATDGAGTSGFFAPANGGIAYSGGGTERFRIAATTGLATFAGAVTITGNVGFYGQAATAKPTGVGVSAAAIHAALVTLNLIA